MGLWRGAYTHGHHRADPAALTVSPRSSPPVPVTLYTLSGVVFEVTSVGRTPVPGVEVYCEPCGPPDGHSARFTDALGAYSFDGPGGVARGTIQMMLAKQGYGLPNQPEQSGTMGGWMGITVVTVQGDTRHDIEITRK